MDHIGLFPRCSQMIYDPVGRCLAIVLNLENRGCTRTYPWGAPGGTFEPHLKAIFPISECYSYPTRSTGRRISVIL